MVSGEVCLSEPDRVLIYAKSEERYSEILFFFVVHEFTGFRDEIVKNSHALEMQSVAMTKNTLKKALSISAEAERKTRLSAETNAAVLMSRLEAYEKQNKHCLQP